MNATIVPAYTKLSPTPTPTPTPMSSYPCCTALTDLQRPQVAEIKKKMSYVLTWIHCTGCCYLCAGCCYMCDGADYRRMCDIMGWIELTMEELMNTVCIGDCKRSRELGVLAMRVRALAMDLSTY
jgi:hypothetical protein